MPVQVSDDGTGPGGGSTGGNKWVDSGQILKQSCQDWVWGVERGAEGHSRASGE